MSENSTPSPYSPNTEADRRAMLKAIGVPSVQELFQDIPAQYREPGLDLPPPMPEPELRRELEALASRNRTPGEYACFLGAGAYRRYVPAVVRQFASRGEFLTSYTPYQPEVSQGTLQVTYEFQSLVCLLTGMEVANAGMYDGASSLAEAALMACRVTRRHRVAVLDTVSPRYRGVLETYFQAPGIGLDVVPAGDPSLADDVACLVVQSPNFYGYLEDLGRLGEMAHGKGALLVVSTDLLSLGMFKPPGEYGADVVTAEAQGLGLATSFGGPYLGVFACKERYLRQVPGRIVGKTVDTRGRTGYVLTLQAREQHIRRERATSNICTSESLMALLTTAYLAVLGKEGLGHVARLCYHKAHYAARLIEATPGYSLPMDGVFFQEFVVRCPRPASELNEALLERGIIGGLDIGDQVPNGMLVCVTEVTTRREIEALAEALRDLA